jgi:hypothetical protein
LLRFYLKLTSSLSISPMLLLIYTERNRPVSTAFKLVRVLTFLMTSVADMNLL